MYTDKDREATKKQIDELQRLLKTIDEEIEDRRAAGRPGAVSTIAKNVEEIKSLIRECENLADEYSLEFDLDVARSLTYHGKGTVDRSQWSESETILEEGQWMTSSDYC